MRRVLLGLAVAALGLSPAYGQIKVDPATPGYQKVSGVSGNINSVGSDTMNNMMALWGETFQKRIPTSRSRSRARAPRRRHPR